MIARYALRFTALGYLTLLLLVPVAMIAWKAFENGSAPFWDVGHRRPTPCMRSS